MGVKKKPSRRREPIPDNTVSRESFDTMIARSKTEDQWRYDVGKLAEGAGFDRQYHTWISIRSQPGFPDDVFTHRTKPRILFIEAKKQTGKLSIRQIGWLDDLARIRDGGNPGIEVYGALRPLDRDRLVNTLYENSIETWGVVEFLHQWCLRKDCERCQQERAKAVGDVTAKLTRQTKARRRDAR